MTYRIHVVHTVVKVFSELVCSFLVTFRCSNLYIRPTKPIAGILALCAPIEILRFLRVYVLKVSTFNLLAIDWFRLQ